MSQQGAGAMVMTLVGPDYFPSVVYTTFTANGSARNFSSLHLVAAGTRPAMFGSCLPQYGGVCLWGDYSAAALDDVDGGTHILEILPTT